MATIPTRRALVLVDEAARHPFLRSLPPHVRQPLEEAAPEESPERKRWLTLRDIREFLMAYCAMFVAVSTFIS